MSTSTTPDMTESEVTDPYLDLLVQVQKHFLRFRRRYDSGEWMERREVFTLWVNAHVAWSKTVEFLAAELGVESRVTGMWRPDWPNVTWEPVEGDSLTLEEIRERDNESDRIISGVYNRVLPALGDMDLNTDNDDLQWIVEDFADRVWEWFDVGAEES